MNYFLLVVAIASMAQCSPSKSVLVVSPKLVKSLTEATAICQLKVGADPFILKNLLPFKLKESELNGKFLYCLMQEMDFEGKNGRVDEEKFMKLFEDSIKSLDEAEIRNILEKCNKENGKSQYLTIYKIANCFHSKTPVVMSL